MAVLAKGPVFADLVSSVYVGEAEVGKTVRFTAFVDVAGYCSRNTDLPDCTSYANGALSEPTVEFLTDAMPGPLGRYASLMVGFTYDGRGAYEASVQLPAQQLPGTYALSRGSGPAVTFEMTPSPQQQQQQQPQQQQADPEPQHGCSSASGLLFALAALVVRRSRAQPERRAAAPRQ